MKFLIFGIGVIAVVVTVAFLLLRSREIPPDEVSFVDIFPSDTVLREGELADPISEEHAHAHEFIEPLYANLGTPNEPTLDERLSQSPTPGFISVLQNVHPDVYAVYACPVDNGQTNVLLITTKYTENPTGNNVNNAMAAMTAWEPFVLEDIGSIIFPQLDTRMPGPRAPMQFTSVTDTGYRSGQVVGNANSVTVYYGWLLIYVLFGSSQECVERVMLSVYEPGV